MVTPGRDLSGLSAGQLFREEESGRLQQREVVAELQRRQRVDRERRQREEAARERRQEIADVQRQRQAILSSERSRQVAEDVLARRRRPQPTAPAPGLERIEPVTPVVREAPPVRREVLERLTPEQIADRVRRGQVGAIQGSVALRARAREAATTAQRQTAERALQSIADVPRIGAPAPQVSRQALQRLAPVTERGRVNVTEALERGIPEATLRDAGVPSDTIRQARQTNEAIKRLERFNTPTGLNLNEAVKEIDIITLMQAGVSRDKVIAAQEQNRALRRLQPFQNEDGSYNLTLAARQGITRKTFSDAGFTDADYKSAQNRVLAQNRLRPFATDGGGYDLVRAVGPEGRKRGINDALLGNAGFTNRQISEAREISRQLNPARGTREWYTKIGKEVGITVADSVVPGLWARNWHQMSNRERATNIALDTLFLVPLIGTAAKAGKAARAATRLTKSQKGTRRTLSSVRAQMPTTQERISRIEQGLRSAENRIEFNRLLVDLKKASPTQVKTPDFQARINRIDRVLGTLERRRQLSRLVDDLASPAPAQSKIRDANLVKSANAVKRVIQRGRRPQDADIAERAALQLGEGLRTGDSQLVRQASRQLALIGRRNDLPALVERVRPALTESGSQRVSDLFRNARKAADDLPDAPGNIKNRVTRIDETIKSIDERLKDVDAPKPEVQTLEREIQVAQDRIQDLRRKTATPERRERIAKLQERVQETRRQVRVAERPIQRPLVEVRSIEEVAQPLARPTTRARAATRTRVRSSAIPETRIAGAQRVKPRAKVQVVTLARPLTRTQELARTATQLAVKTDTRADTRVSTQVTRDVRTRTRQEVAAAPRTRTQTQTRTTTRTGQQVITEPKTTPATDPQVTAVPKPAPETTTRTRPERPLTPGRPVPTRPGRPSRKFDLPGDAEKSLKPGEFPRTVTWRQGLFNITVDIDRGTRTFSKAKGTGKGTSPDETFKVLTKDRTRPTAKQFDQGVVKLNVTPRRVFFSRRKLNK